MPGGAKLLEAAPWKAGCVGLATVPLLPAFIDPVPLGLTPYEVIVDV